MNDVIKPEVIWIEGRCYRINDTTAEALPLQEHDLYENDIPYNEYIEEDINDVDSDCEILQVDAGRLSSSLHVSKHYMGSIIGKKGATIARIERDTRTEIKTPRHGENKDVTIFGSGISNVIAALRRLNIIIMSCRMKQAYTHFVSIPMNSPDIVKKFNSFKENVIRECPAIEESLFIKPNKLHITIGVTCLMDNEERILASKLLTEAKDKLVMPIFRECMPLNVKLKGLSYMNDDPKTCHVLYARVVDDGALQAIADAVHAHFYRAGFMDKKFNRDNVKLHVTLLNSRYRANQKQNDDDNTCSIRSKRESFDGSEILSKFSDYDFGVIPFNSLHLSQRSTVGPDGYYQPTCVVSCT